MWTHYIFFHENCYCSRSFGNLIEKKTPPEFYSNSNWNWIWCWLVDNDETVSLNIIEKWMKLILEQSRSDNSEAIQITLTADCAIRWENIPYNTSQWASFILAPFVVIHCHYHFDTWWGHCFLDTIRACSELENYPEIIIYGNETVICLDIIRLIESTWTFNFAHKLSIVCSGNGENSSCVKHVAE